ncbi:MAG: TonB-dependent receptor [Novosphingobium sp.]
MKRATRNLLLAASLGLVASPRAHAQEVSPPAAPPIIVTGRGLADPPAAPAYDVQEIGRETLITTASGRIEEALGSVAGFQQFRRSDSRSANPSAQGATLRALGGNATSRTLVLLDGVPMADPFFGYIPFSALAPGQLASVRVTRGGGAGAFGAGAVAGTIELTSAGIDELARLEGSALAGQDEAVELSASAASRLGRGFAVASVRYDRGDGFFTTPRAQRVAATVPAAYRSWSAGLRGVAPLAPGVELHARGLAFDDRRTLRFAGADSASRGQDASVRVIGRGRWRFDALAYVQVRDFSNVVISATTFRRTLDQRRTPSTGLGGKLELRPPTFAGHALRLGADARIATGALQEDAYNAATGLVTARRRAGGRNSDVGVYVEDDWRRGALVLTAGARADRWTVRGGFFRESSADGAVVQDDRFAARSGWDASLRGGAVLALGGGLRLRGSAYQGLRLPTLNELYRPFVVFPVTTRANPALTNERLVGLEAGLDFAPDPRLSLTLTAFDNRVRDAVANVTLSATVRERRNVDAVRARGLELGAHAALGPVAFDGSLALTEAEIEASGASAGLDGLRPAQTPRLAASAALAWRPRDGWLASVSLRHVGAQFEDDLETDRLPPATTVNAYAEAPLGSGLALVLRAENLFDARLVTRNQGGSIDLGAPRRLWAGVRARLP